MTHDPYLCARDLCIDYPIYNADSRSLKKRLMGLPLGARLTSWGSGKTGVKVEALRHIEFELGHGDRLGVIGHNGAGKTTLLRALAGIYEPVSGRIEWRGRVATLFDVMLGLDTEASGYENIMMRGLLLGFSKQELAAQADEIAAFTELGEYLSMPVRTYSTGMMLRLGFAVCTTISPDILLMDEWLSVGDADFTEKAKGRLDRLIAQTGILVLASHDQHLIEALCNKVLWLEHGQVKGYGATADVLARYRGDTAAAAQ